MKIITTFLVSAVLILIWAVLFYKPEDNSKNMAMAKVEKPTTPTKDSEYYDADVYDNGYDTDYGYYSAPEKVKIFFLNLSFPDVTEKAINEWLADGKNITGVLAVNTASGSISIIYRYQDVVETTPDPTSV